MGLEEVVKAQEKFFRINGLAKAIKENEPIDYAKRFVDYLGLNEQTSQAEIQAVYNRAETKREEFKGDVEAAIGDAKRGLVQAVQEDPEAVLKATDPGILIDLASKIPAEKLEGSNASRAKLHEMYQSMAGAVQKGDVEPYLADLKERNIGFWKYFSERLSPEEIKVPATARANMLRAIFDSSFRNSEGKDKGKYNPNIAQNYVREILDKYSPDKKANVLFALGANLGAGREDMNRSEELAEAA